MKQYLTALAAALVLATSVAATAATAPASFKLNAQNDSGETGTATITQGDGEILVSVKTTGGGADPQPIHIHKGTCAKLDPKPAYPLTTLQDGTSVTHVKDVTLADLESGDYAINVHKSTKEVAVYVACGDLKPAKPAAK